MKKYPNLILLTFLISGCCSIDKKDFEFNSNELSHFSDYKAGDTIYFQSNLGNIDTITIVGFGNERYDKCGGVMQGKPLNGRWVKIRHLPVDKWYGTSQDMTTGGKVEIVYQALFWITKYPTDRTTNYDISFKDFYSRSDTTVGKYFADTLMLNDLRFSNYYKVEPGHPESVNRSENIKTVYWTDEFGLTAYESRDGEVWTKEIAKTIVPGLHRK